VIKRSEEDPLQGSVAPKVLARRLTVVYVIDNMRYGGTELNAVRTAERLNPERFDLRVLCIGDEGPLSERYRRRGIPVVMIPLRSFYGTTMFSAGWNFMRYLRRERVDVVHAHDVYSNIFAVMWARLGRTPVVIASRRWWHSLPNAKLRWGNRVVFPLADAILANSGQVAKTILNEGIPSDRVWTVPNFVDDEAFGELSNADRIRLRTSWGAPENSVVLGCVARFDPVKDHATLIRAFAVLRDRHPEVFLVLIGDGPTRPQLEQLIEEMDLKGSVHLAGELRAGSNLHHGLDISVLSSKSEGFPNSVVEAMAAGNPVVATSVGGTIDAVIDGETGLLVPPSDPSALEQALSKLVIDEQQRRRFGNAGKAHARKHFQASAVVSQVESMYQRLRTIADR